MRITLPEIQPTQIQVLSPAQVRALADAMNPRYAITVLAGYGLGLRQGEALALSRSRIDFQHHTYRVDRQVITCARTGSQPCFAPPKTKASRRTAPSGNISKHPENGDQSANRAKRDGRGRRSLIA